MASGTGEWSGNWMKASNSGAYRFVKVDSTSFNESTGVTTVNWHVGTYVSYGNFYGSVVSSWGSCTHSYALNGAGGYDYHYATTNVAYNGNIHFIEGCGYTSSSAGGWIQSALDVYWYPTLPTYAVSYNANGGSGAPSAQTKTWGTTLKLSSTVPTRTGYTFGGWNTKSDGTGTTYQAGNNYTANANVTLYAKWSINTYPVNYANGGHGTAPSPQTKTYGTALTLRPGMGTVSNYKFKDWKATNGTTYSGGGSYTANATTTMTAEWYAPYSVTYDANGGSGAPSSQVKVYGDSVNISSTVPTRTNYNFIEWNTNASGTGTKYTAGQAYSTNANLALYAIWEIAHSNPTISNLLVQRCLQDGTLADDGEYCKVSATVSVDNSTEGYTDTKLKTVTVQVGSNAAESVTVDTTATSASISFISANQLSLTSTYVVKLTVADSHDFSSYRTSTISIAYFTMHFKEGGHGIAIGKKSTVDDLFDVNMDARMQNINFENNKRLYWKEAGYGDKFAIVPSFNGADDANLLKIQSAVGGASTDPELSDKVTISGKSGNVNVVGGVGAAGTIVAGVGSANQFHVGGGASYVWMDNRNASGTMQNNIVIYPGYVKTGHRLEANAGGDSWVSVAKNHLAGFYANKSGASAWSPAISTTSANGSCWSIGTYNNENLLFVYVTKANMDASNNASTIVNLPNNPGTIPVPVQLYYNATGTNGTVTLSQTAANFNYLRIFYKKSDAALSCGSTDVYAPNGKRASLVLSNYDSSTMQVAHKVINISGTSITVLKDSYINYQTGNTGWWTSVGDANVYIYRVEGWK